MEAFLLYKCGVKLEFLEKKKTFPTRWLHTISYVDYGNRTQVALDSCPAGREVEALVSQKTIYADNKMILRKKNKLQNHWTLNLSDWIGRHSWRFVKL